MLPKQARTVHWKKWAAQHECEEPRRRSVAGANLSCDEKNSGHTGMESMATFGKGLQGEELRITKEGGFKVAGLRSTKYEGGEEERGFEVEGRRGSKGRGGVCEGGGGGSRRSKGEREGGRELRSAPPLRSPSSSPPSTSARFSNRLTHQSIDLTTSVDFTCTVLKSTPLPPPSSSLLLPPSDTALCALVAHAEPLLFFVVI